MLLPINSQNPEISKIKTVVETLKNGGVVVYPTDTIYGIGCDIFCPKAIEKIYQLKQKDARQNPFSFICADFKQVSNFAVLSNEIFRLMKRVLPGPFTFILPASYQAPREVIQKKKRTVGIRIPDNNVCLEMVKMLGNPIITTSVNVSGNAVLNDPLQIENSYGKLVDIIIDAGILPIEPSTIVDGSGADLQIIRQGKGKLTDLLKTVEN